MTWEAADRVQKNDAGEFRAMIGGEWVPVARVQKNEAGEFRVDRTQASVTAQEKPSLISGLGSRSVAPTIAEPTSPYSATNLAGAAVEPSMTLVSGMLATPLAGLSGIAGSVLPGPAGQGANWSRNVANAMTYAPQTEGGKTALGAIAYPFEKLAEGADWAGGKTSDVFGPAAGAAVNTALQAAPMLMGTKYMPSMPKIGETAPVRAVTKVASNLFGPIEGRAGRLTRDVAGPTKVDDVISALKAHQDTVPGSVATAGQAATPAGSAEFAALQEIIAKRAPSKYGSAGIEGAQEGARRSAVGDIARLPDWENPVMPHAEAAKAVRSANADVNYGNAYTNVIRADPELLAMSKNPYFKDALPDAIKLAEARGINAKDNLTEVLHFVKLSLDKQLQKRGDTALSSTEKATVAQLQENLVGWVGRKNKDYESARAGYASDSGPVNRMKAGKAIEDALVSSLGTTERPTVFANLVKKAGEETSIGTGKPRMADLTPPERGTVEAVIAELANDAKYTKMAREGGEAARRTMGLHIPKIQPTGFFSPIASFSRGAYNRAANKATDKVIDALATKMDNPQEMARIMQNVTPAQRSAIVEALMKRANVGAIQGAFGGAAQGE